MTKRNQLGLLLIIFNLLILFGTIKYGMVKFYDIKIEPLTLVSVLTEEDLTPKKLSWKDEYQMIENTSVVQNFGDLPGRRINKYNRLIEKYSRSVSIDPNLLRSLIRQESMGIHNAVSHTGVVGLTQLTNAAAKEVGITDRGNPEQSILGGARYLDKLIKRFHGNVKLASVAYNAGSGYVWRAVNRAGEGANTTDVLLALKEVMSERGLAIKWKRETLPHLTNIWDQYIALSTHDS